MGVLAHWRRLTRTAIVVVCLSASASIAQQNETVATSGPAIGPETNLPLPRFVSLRANEANVRRGPSLSHRIDWVFKRRNMPLKVIDEYGHWRRVTDRDDEGGWVHHSLLSGTRTVIIQDDLMPIYARADPSTLVNAHLQAGVVARLRKCTRDWCQISVDGYRGWAIKTGLWGVEADELRD